MKPDIPQIQRELDIIQSILAESPEPLSRRQVAELLPFGMNTKTLQRRLQKLVVEEVATMSGERGAARYALLTRQEVSLGVSLVPEIEVSFASESPATTEPVFSAESLAVLQFFKTPAYARPLVSYNRAFLDAYVPNQSAYLSQALRNQLYTEGRRFDANLAAGTYARHICQRLLIDLSYNSSRLEGNTYSRLDTQKLLEEGISAAGKIHEETVMIMNHKEAILFLVEGAAEIELNALTIRNLHHLLSQDLLGNPEACGNIRAVEVDIGHSTYKPINNPHVLKELFELILLKARKIQDAFEQSFFLMVHLSYLQAFEDVNKRTSRLACNIPFIKKNLCPLSFTDISRDDYMAALLAVYEKNDIKPMRDLYVWAYQRSCRQYGVVKKTIGEIDVFRIKFRQQRKDVMGRVVALGLHGKQAEHFIEAFCREHNIQEQDRFSAMCLADLGALHAGAIVGLRITEGQFNQWWEKKP